MTYPKLFRALSLSLAVCAGASLLVGCGSKTIVIVEPDTPPTGETEVEVVVVDPQRDLVEIRSAAQLSFENDRLNAMLRIAKRIDLSREGQLALVEQAAEVLKFDSHRAELLMAVARHPALRHDTLLALYAAVETLKFESNRVRLMRALEKAKPVDAASGELTIGV
ncbi:MAG: hypothetical protein AAF823_00330 [Planctomycetota bacterium]